MPFQPTVHDKCDFRYHPRVHHRRMSMCIVKENMVKCQTLVSTASLLCLLYILLIHITPLLIHLLMHILGGDIFIHAKSDSMGKLFELAQLIQLSLPKNSVAKFSDVYAFVFREGRDLSGFIDGKCIWILISLRISF